MHNRLMNFIFSVFAKLNYSLFLLLLCIFINAITNKPIYFHLKNITMQNLHMTFAAI